jgi:hypothetical protein
MNALAIRLDLLGPRLRLVDPLPCKNAPNGWNHRGASDAGNVMANGTPEKSDRKLGRIPECELKKLVSENWNYADEEEERAWSDLCGWAWCHVMQRAREQGSSEWTFIKSQILDLGGRSVRKEFKKQFFSIPRFRKQLLAHRSHVTTRRGRRATDPRRNAAWARSDSSVGGARGRRNRTCHQRCSDVTHAGELRGWSKQQGSSQRRRRTGDYLGDCVQGSREWHQLSGHRPYSSTVSVRGQPGFFWQAWRTARTTNRPQQS